MPRALDQAAVRNTQDVDILIRQVLSTGMWRPSIAFSTRDRVSLPERCESRLNISQHEVSNREEILMGAHPYWYFEKYEGDVEESLQTLRDREFQAGRYNPVMPFIRFPLGPNSPAPGAQHDSIEEAMIDADADGTRSILDLLQVSEDPDFCTAHPLSADVLMALYGTCRPSRKMVEQNMDFLEDVERGQGVYILLSNDGELNEVFFAGYSFD